MATHTFKPRRYGWVGRCALLAGIALPAVAMGAPAAAATLPTRAGADTASVPDCTPEDLKTIVNDRGAAAGTTYIDLAMIKVANGDNCLMDTRADMVWVDTYDGDQVGGQATYMGEAGEPFVLTEGDYAEVTIAQPNPGNYDPQVCEPVEAAGMRIKLVGWSEGAYVPTGGDTVCANPDVGVPQISPVTKYPH